MEQDEDRGTQPGQGAQHAQDGRFLGRRVQHRPVAIAFGGSIVAPAESDPAFLVEVARAVTRLAQHRPLLIAVGGGTPARQAIRAARTAGVREEDLDRIGIAATRLNAQSLCALLRMEGADVNIEPPHTIADAVALVGPGRVVVMGGTTPGHSTDFVAAELAVASGADRLVVATNVDGVYERDPKKDPTAKRLGDLDFLGLMAVVEDKAWTQAGAAGVLDGPATLLVAREGLETCVVQGTDLPNLEAACSGRAFHGTRVAGDKVVP